MHFLSMFAAFVGICGMKGCHATCSGDTSNVVSMCKNSVKTGTDLRLDTSLASTLELPGGTGTIKGCTCFVETRIGKTLNVWSNYSGAPGSDCGTSVKIGENIGQSFGTPCYSAPYRLSVGTQSNVSVDMELKRPRTSYDANYCVTFTLNYCSNTRFQCNNGACILESKHCDSVADCADSEDELNCPGSCNEGDILCDDQRTCIKPSMRCDNQSIDCLDGSDEAPKYCDPNYVPGTGGGNGAALMAQMTITCLESEYLPATTTSTTTTTTTTTTPTTTTKTTTPTTTSTTPKATTTTTTIRTTTSTTTTPKPTTTTSTTESTTTTPQKTTTTTTSTSTTSTTPFPTTKTSPTSISPIQTTSKTTSTSQPTTKPSFPTSTTSTSTSSTISSTKTSATTQTTSTSTTQSTNPTVKSSSTTKVVTTSEKATSEPTTKEQPSSSTKAASTTSTTSKSTTAQTSTSTPPPPATTKQQVVTTEADVDDKVLIVAIVSGVAGLILLIICIICWIRTAHWNRRKTPKMKRYIPENGEPPTHSWYPAVQNNAYTVETVLKAEDLKINDVYIADPESAPRFEPIYAYPKKKTKPNEFILSSL